MGLAQLNKKRSGRPKTSCVFHGHSIGQPMCTLTTYPTCHPDTCPWYRNEDMMQESYEKAREIWARNHGTDNYYELGYGQRVRHLPRKNPDEEEN